MKELAIEKVCLNIGVGEPGDKLEKAVTLLKKITGEHVVKTKAKKRIPEFHLRQGLEIGARVTMRGKKALELLKKLLSAVDNRLKQSQFDRFGNVSFGVKEYIYIPDVRYDPKIGIMGLDVTVTLKKPGHRVTKRTYRRSHIGAKQKIVPKESIEFFRSKLGVEIV